MTKYIKNKDKKVLIYLQTYQHLQFNLQQFKGIYTNILKSLQNKSAQTSHDIISYLILSN